MTAMTKDKVRREREGRAYGYPVLGGLQIFFGSLVAITAAGKAVPVGHTDGQHCVGLAKNSADNRDDDADPPFVEAVKGVYALDFDTAPTHADIKKPVYAVDDGTVTLTSGTLLVGTLDGIDGTEFFVRID